MSALNNSLNNGPHKLLQQFTGTWSGSTKTWFERDSLADESPMKGKISSILGGRFLLYEYEGAMQEKPFTGMVIFGYHLLEKKPEAAWVDSFHTGTGIMFSTGTEQSFSENKYTVTGSYGDGQDEPRWGWRTELELTDPETLVITAYNISPDGQAAKATETIYQKIINNFPWV